jgi:hypothetical protein
MVILNELQYDQGVGEVFDRYAEPDQEGEVLHDRRDRAIALACMIAYTQGHSDWPGILDGAMRERGAESHFTELPSRQVHIEAHRAAGRVGEITKKCTSMASIITALCKD